VVPRLDRDDPDPGWRWSACPPSSTGWRTWPDRVPLGQPFQIREPARKWGLGGALIEGAGVLVIVRLVKLARNLRRHRQQGTTPASATMRYIR
jgi:hypothetical protein